MKQITLAIFVVSILGGAWIYLKNDSVRLRSDENISHYSHKNDQSERFINIGTGGLTGIYYPVGGAICRLLNRNTKEHGLKCSVESTGGSVYNLNTLKKGEFDFAIAQSDLIYQAYHPTDESKAVQPNKELRTVLTLYTEPLTLIAREDANIKNLEDLRKKRVNIGAPGSGQRATMLALIKAIGWTTKDFSQLSGLNPVEQSLALCDDKVEAIVYSVGHPNGSIQEAIATCQARFVPLIHSGIDQLLKTNPYYVRYSIPQNLYRGMNQNIDTFGVKVALMTTTQQDPYIVEQLLGVLVNNFESFKRLHPVLSSLNIEDLLTIEGLIAPHHEGVNLYKSKYKSHIKQRKK